VAVVLPPAAAGINVTDYALSKVQDGLQKPVNALLAFAHGLQTGTTAEALRVASLAAVGAITAASLTIAGAITARSINLTGALAVTSLTATGTVTGASLVSTGGVTSANGFKTILGPFVLSTTSGSGSYALTSITALNNAAATNSFYLPWVAPYAGSILAISGTLVRTTGITTTTAAVVLQPTINEVTQFSSPPTISIGSSTAYGTVVKGNSPFNAGDRVSVFVNVGAAAAATVVCYLVVEMAA
jgi:hypothetical protein